MDYISVEEAIDTPGLRLVLTAGAPGPWSESAKAILTLKNIPYIPVRQDGGGENSALQAWTGQTSAPVAIYNDELPRCQSLDILFLAERLNPEPPLIPDAVEPRVQMFGLIREIIGEQGFAWNRRLLMLQPIMQVDGMQALATRLGTKYGYSDSAVRAASQRCVEILACLTAQLQRQRNNESRYFIGGGLTALDIYWANFASMLKPLPHKDNPMNEAMRQTYEHLPEQLADACDPVLLQHRDYIYQQYLTLPLDF